MKVLLINPAYHELIFPVDVGILAAIADQLGHNVAILDVNAHKFGLDTFRRELLGDDWDLVYIHAQHTQYQQVEAYAPLIRQAHPTSIIAIGGPLASALPAGLMQLVSTIDLVLHEDLPFRAWTQVLQRTVDMSYRWNEISGIAYRVGLDTRIALPGPAGEPLDALPFPAYELLPLDVYFQNSPLNINEETRQARRRIDVGWSRGCSFHSKLCPTSTRIQRASARYTVDHLLYLRKKFGVDFVSFIDRNFTVDPQQVHLFCDLLEKEELVGLMGFGCSAHSRSVSYPLLQRLRDVGFSYVEYELISGSPKCLRDTQAHHSIAQIQAALHATKTAQLTPIGVFVLGSENETTEDIKETLRLWQKFPMKIELHYATPIPGSVLYAEHLTKIMREFGTLRNFLIALKNSSSWLTMNLSNHYDKLHLMGLRLAMLNADFQALENQKPPRSALYA